MATFFSTNYTDLWLPKHIVMNTRIQNLSIDERIRLVEDFWDSIAAEQEALPLTAVQKAELDQRLDAYEIDRDRGRLAIDAVAEIRSKL